MKKTKIIATIWPATSNEKKLIGLYNAWVNIIRFNFSHANYEEAKEKIKIINKINEEGLTNLSLLIDTKWPEIRTWELKEKNTYKKSEIFKIYTDEKIKLKQKDLYCDYPYITQDLKRWDNIVIDSWLLNVKVLNTKKWYIEVKALNNAEIWSKRHINLPWTDLRLPWITKKDKKDIIFALENDFSFIAASFIRTAENVKEIKKILKQYNKTKVKIIAKIENQQWIDNIDEIIEESDWIMVARWDLWIEVPIEKLALYQREIIEKAKIAWKFIIIATHLLETMIYNPFPTRAESSDIFNSILQKPDCLMLSWETAIWRYPVSTVEMMTKIIKESEKNLKYEHSNYSNKWLSIRNIEKKLLIRSGIYIWEELWVKAMILLTKSWLLARIASAFRPWIKVYAFTKYKSSVKTMNSLFWIEPIFLKNWNQENFDKTLKEAIKYLQNKKIIKKEDKVVAINDLQTQLKEIPIMEIVSLNDI